MDVSSIFTDLGQGGVTLKYSGVILVMASILSVMLMVQPFDVGLQDGIVGCFLRCNPFRRHKIALRHQPRPIM